MSATNPEARAYNTGKAEAASELLDLYHEARVDRAEAQP